MPDDTWAAVEGRRRKGWFWSENAVFELTVSAYAKLTYLYLCRRADNDVRQSYPSLQRIADDLGVSVDTVRRSVQELRAAGAIRVKTGGGRGRSTRYQVQEIEPVGCLETVAGSDPLAGPSAERVADSGKTVAHGDGKGSRGSTEGRPIEETPTKEDPQYLWASSFDRFWAVYPRKADKAKAQAKWKKIVDDETLAGVIIADVGRRLKRGPWLEALARAEPHFIPLPSTYLHGRRWEDEEGPGQVIDIRKRVNEGHAAEPAGDVRL